MHHDASAWPTFLSFIERRFGIVKPKLEAILMLIGIQELQKFSIRFNKNDKINLMHVAVCTLLSQRGYYTFSHRDEHNWPHFVLARELPNLNLEGQNELLQDLILQYFAPKGLK